MEKGGWAQVDEINGGLSVLCKDVRKSDPVLRYGELAVPCDWAGIHHSGTQQSWLLCSSHDVCRSMKQQVDTFSLPYVPNTSALAPSSLGAKNNVIVIPGVTGISPLKFAFSYCGFSLLYSFHYRFPISPHLWSVIRVPFCNDSRPNFLSRLLRLPLSPRSAAPTQCQLLPTDNLCIESIAVRA